MFLSCENVKNLHQKNVPSVLQHVSLSSVPAAPVPALNEKILHHNAELTSYVTRLSNEKEDLRQRVNRLEEEKQQARPQATTQDPVSRVFTMCSP